MCRSAQDAIDADPGWAGAYETLASIYATQGQHQILLRDNEAAYESYWRILLLDLEGEVLTGSVLAGAYYGMGRALHAEGIGAEAVSNMERAVSLSPRDAEMQLRLAHLLIERGERFRGDGELPLAPDLNETLKVLRRALSLQYHPYLWLHQVTANQRVFDWCLSCFFGGGETKCACVSVCVYYCQKITTFKKYYLETSCMTMIFVNILNCSMMLKKMMTLKIQKYPRFTKISQILEMSCVYIGSTCDTLSKCMSNFRIKSKS